MSYLPSVLHCVNRKFGYLQEYWHFPLELSPKLRTKFRHGILIVETCYQLNLRKVDAQNVINWAVVGQLSR